VTFENLITILGAILGIVSLLVGAAVAYLTLFVSNRLKDTKEQILRDMTSANEKLSQRMEEVFIRRETIQAELKTFDVRLLLVEERFNRMRDAKVTSPPGGER